MFIAKICKNVTNKRENCWNVYSVLNYSWTKYFTDNQKES
jgi:hypothetical protein